jgi:hypothetical protein
MRNLRHLTILFCVFFMTACYWPWQNSPPQGEHRLGVAFQHQESDQWCAIACISMWVKFRGTPYPARQQDIYDYILWESSYWWTMGAGGSLSNQGIQNALWDYSYIGTDNQYYVPSESRILIADIQKGISVGSPTIVVTNSGMHAKLVIGASWHQLGNYQPNVDVMITADPWDYGARVDSVGYWLTNVGNGDPGSTFYNTIHSSGQKFSALGELAEFDSWGGTYYGDPEPPNGCEGCLPLMAEPSPQPTTSWLRGVLSLFASNRAPHLALASRRAKSVVPSQSQEKALQRGYRQPVGPAYRLNHAVRREIFVPWPQTQSAQRVFDNARAGMRQLNLTAVQGWEGLDLAIESLEPSSIERVVSLSNDLEYWLVTLKFGGRPYAKAIVNRDGWLLSAMRADENEDQFETKRSEWAQALVRQTGHSPRGARLVHLAGNLAPHLGSEDYSPLFEVTTDDGGPVYVAQDGLVFREEVGGPLVGHGRHGRKTFVRVR